MPVVPMALSGLWRSVFSRNPSWNRASLYRWFPQVRLSVGDALGADRVTPEGLRAQVLALRGDWR